MPSIVQTHIADRETFLDRHRRAYLAGICAERGIIPPDLRRAALIEARSMIELAEGFDTAQHRIPTHNKE